MNIVFDFGNVLFEWNPEQLVAEHFASPLPPSLSPVRFADALVNHRDWLDFDLGFIDSHELSLRSQSRLGLDARALKSFVDRIPHVLPQIESTVKCVHALIGSSHRVFYLSNMPTAFADVLEVRCPWIASFEAGIFSGRAKLSKPDPAIYAAAELAFQLDPANTLFLDDVLRNVEAARDRGWHAELITGPQSTSDALNKHGVWQSASDSRVRTSRLAVRRVGT